MSFVKLAWTTSADRTHAGYKIHWGTTSRVYTFVEDVGDIRDRTPVEIAGLADGRWYVAVTSYDRSGNESGFSKEITVDVGSNVATPTVPDGLQVMTTSGVTSVTITDPVEPPDPPPPPPDNQPPVSVISTPVVSGLTVALDGSGSSDPDGDVISHSWDLGDGQSATGVNPSHTYAVGGTYTIRLTVSDGSLSHTTSVDVAVAPAPTIAAPTDLVIVFEDPDYFLEFDPVVGATLYGPYWDDPPTFLSPFDKSNFDGRWTAAGTALGARHRIDLSAPGDGQKFFVTALDAATESTESNIVQWSTPPPPPPPPAGIIFEDDPDNMTTAQRNFWNGTGIAYGDWNSNNNGLGSVLEVGEFGIAKTGTFTWRQTITFNEQAGWAMQELSPALTEIYFAWWGYWGAQYDFAAGQKLVRIGNWAGSLFNWQVILFQSKIVGPQPEDLNTFALAYNGGPVDFGARHFNPGAAAKTREQWVHYECRIKMNSAAESSDGEFQMWVDDVQKINVSNIQYTNVSADLNFDLLQLGGWYSNSATGPPVDPSPVAAVRYIDRWVTSSGFIGKAYTI